MDVRSSTIAIALVLAATSFAGCIENADWLNRGDAEVTAMTNKPAADAAAADWHADAKLVGVMAFELADSPDPRIDADPDPGNGFAPAWWYVYHAPTDEGPELRAWKVAADGTLTSEQEAEMFAATMDHDMAEELVGWTIDSDAAIQAAKTDAKFRKVAEGFNATVVEGVAHHGDITAWWVSAMSADGFAVATIDAATGEVITVDMPDMDFDMPDFEWGAANPSMTAPPVHIEDAGELAPGEPVEYPFSVTTPMWGILEARASTGAPFPGMGGVAWHILDDEGDAVADGYLDRRSDDEPFEIEIEEPGAYTLVFEYVSWTSWLPVPGASGAEYEFMMHLDAGHMHHEKSHEH